MTALTDEAREQFVASLRQNLGYRAWVIEDTMLGTVEQIVAAALTTAASAIEARRHTYVQSGGLPELIPSNHADAERLGHLDGLAAAAEIVRALAAPQTPDADLRP